MNVLLDEWEPIFPCVLIRPLCLLVLAMDNHSDGVEGHFLSVVKSILARGIWDSFFALLILTF